MDIEVIVDSIIVDPVSKMPVVIVREKAGKRVLPIWIGFAEANGIVLALEGINVPRPQTYDLFVNILKNLKYDITKIIITALKDNTYFAKIIIRNIENDNEIEVDSRPSDALALALRFNAIIFADNSLLREMKDSMIENMDDLKHWLEELNPEQLGKYKM
jgi:bifunctional DNase/RNase